jgi:hypothetical protein
MKPPKNAIAKSVSNRSTNERLLQHVGAWDQSILKRIETFDLSDSFEQFVTGIVLFVKILYQGIEVRLSTSKLITNRADYSVEKFVLKIGERYKV